MCEHTCTYTYTHAHIHTYKRKTCHLSSVYRLENDFWPPPHLSPMISTFMALLIIPSNIYTSQFSHDDHLHFGGGGDLRSTPARAYLRILCSRTWVWCWSCWFCFFISSCSFPLLIPSRSHFSLKAFFWCQETNTCFYICRQLPKSLIACKS